MSCTSSSGFGSGSSSSISSLTPNIQQMDSRFRGYRRISDDTISMSEDIRKRGSTLGTMSSNDENFHEIGPKHLTATIDWKNEDYQRSVIASLVQGVYSLETGRQRKNAEPWWTSFNFDLDQTLIDGKCIFGAIYKYNGKNPVTDSNVPKYVIAFRGTLLNPKNWMKDMKLNFKCFRSKLEGSNRFELAMDHVEHLVEANGAPNVWLAGHSLGSAIALLVGKKMILKKKWFPKAYLFNPPFLSLPIEMLKDKKVKKGIRCVHRMLKARLTLAVQPSNYTRLEDHFALLSSWTPHMFVNPADIICAAYIAYFKRRVGAGSEIMKLAENNSLRNLVCHVVFQIDLKDTMHLLPSAILIVNESYPNKKVANNSSLSYLRKAHTICQWWHPDVHCQSTLYQ